MDKKRSGPSLLKGHPYRHSTEGVDVRDTWRKYGWKPKAETGVKTADQRLTLIKKAMKT